MAALPQSQTSNLGKIHAELDRFISAYLSFSFIIYLTINKCIY